MVELGLPDALRRLALPTEPGKEMNAVNAVRDFLVSQGMSHSDQAEHLRQLTEDWFLTQQDPDPQLRQVIRKAITAAFPDADSSFSGSYHRAHRKLRDDHVLSFEEA